ncbi:MAG: universal stress protein [Gemmatimonadaceae bacterium]
MYSRILVPLEHSSADAAVLHHVRSLAKCFRSEVVLIHVADGWVARNLRQLDLQESDEMRGDRDYLEQVCADLENDGFTSDAIFACGDPATEIAAAADREQCELIAMSTHGHRLFKDILLGSVANEVRHRTTIPVLLVRATKGVPVPTIRGPSPANSIPRPVP